MHVTVTLNADIPLVEVVPGDSTYELPEEATVARLIDLIDAKNPGFKDAVIVQDGAVSKQFLIFVDGDNIEHNRGLATVLHAGDSVNIIPAIAGG